MKSLFLDSANLKEIEQMVKTDAIAGVTTNPSLMAKEEKGAYEDRLLEICSVIRYNKSSRKHLSVEVTTLDVDLMMKQALFLKDYLGEFARAHGDVFVKIPVMMQTLPVITKLAEQNIKVNATACMTAFQAKLAEDAGAQIVSFFYNRMIDGFRSVKPGQPGEHSDEVGARIAAAREIMKFVDLKRSSQIICGSIRKPSDVFECWSAGAEIVTASLKVIEGMVSHPKTDEAINQFQKDIDSWLK